MFKLFMCGFSGQQCCATDEPSTRISKQKAPIRQKELARIYTHKTCKIKKLWFLIIGQEKK